MRYRELPRTGLRLSEVGFGVWTISTGWWGRVTEDEAIRLLKIARERGITFFDAADVYGYGLGEELLGKAFGSDPGVVIATKVGYDFYGREGSRSDDRELPQNFSPAYLCKAVEACLRRLRRETIDILQLHNVRMEHVRDDRLWETVRKLQEEGKIRAYGAALGPAIGWLYEGIEVVRRRQPHVVQHIYNILETYPGRQLMDQAGPGPTRYLIRVPHASGMLEGKYTSKTTFGPNDHRRFRSKEWLEKGLVKIHKLRFLERDGRTLGQAAIQWLLEDPRIVSVLPNIYNEDQLEEFVGASEAVPLTVEELSKIESLIQSQFGVEPEKVEYKGTMHPPEELASSRSGSDGSAV
ncbi:aldo/keto reductase [Candidatus Methylacidithermus pantelleriae]|uniref:Predicted oxidoreductase n=1 Tax=Candidatus Methylacidithermus pantelleriae TaxID=2744239 RepID=A0A8J2BJ93_9BACT|nr:aldo/keto reductase [Candidatus Methylacidithermus pantelleriae]CAF0696238.1 Predicted oxidoreductase [Candidatus Methylacidithermus pantelleriae]